MSPLRDDRHDAWFARLRERFLEVASARVEPDVAEDLVQDALRIVHEKAELAPGALVDGRPALAWCFQVLRNVIGNYYQKRRRPAQIPIEENQMPGSALTPLESLMHEQQIRLLHRALGELERVSEQCARYLRQVVAGDLPAAIARTEREDPAVIHRRLYRCRERLRDILTSWGVQP